MFWERFYELCNKCGTKPNPLGAKIGISSGVVTKWKNGTIPNGETLIKIADELNCSIDYLLGRTDIPDLIFNDNSRIIEISEGHHNTIPIRIAASDGHTIKRTAISKDELEALKALPDINEDEL